MTSDPQETQLMLRALKLQASMSVAGDVEILQTLKVALFLMASPHVDIQELIKTAEPEDTQIDASIRG